RHGRAARRLRRGLILLSPLRRSARGPDLPAGWRGHRYPRCVGEPGGGHGALRPPDRTDPRRGACRQARRRDAKPSARTVELAPMGHVGGDLPRGVRDGARRAVVDGRTSQGRPRHRRGAGPRRDGGRGRRLMVGSIDDPRRAEPPTVAGEREMLEAWLEFHRTTLLLKCEGLGPADLARRPLASSTMSLHGLVRHMADVERNWFQRVLGSSRDPRPIYWTRDDPEGDWEGVDDADWAA